MSEVFSAKYLGTDILNLNACETTCDADSDCWMVMFTPPYGCVKVAYSTVELVAGIETDNSLLRVKGKFCIEGIIHEIYLICFLNIKPEIKKNETVTYQSVTNYCLTN